MTGEGNSILEDSVPKTFNELLDRMGNTNPRFRLLAEFMKQKEEWNISEDLEKKARRKRIKRDILELKREYDVLVQMNDLLASALGACPYCWGWDENCECLGQGRPGSRLPDKEAFQEFVLPVIKKLGIVKENSQSKLT